MIIEVNEKYRQNFDALALHPLQSWAWGQFRKKTGIEILRLGRLEKNILKETAQITFHQIPFSKYYLGYFPKGGLPSGEMLKKLKEIGRQKNCLFIKLEPAVAAGDKPLKDNELIPSPHPLFTKYTFQLDLTPSEDELLKNMSSKTRYNIRLGQKKGVYIEEDDSQEAFNTYLNLLEATTKRQKFFAHSLSYHRLMWETLRKEKIAHLLLAKYKTEGKEKILVAWIVFLFNNILYYPYGASASEYRNFMPSNLMMWEAIRFGKKHQAKMFDMWGALGPAPDPTDPWFGFHKFKEGYGATLTEFVGSYDLVINPALYRFYNGLHYLRNIYLALKSSFRK